MRAAVVSIGVGASPFARRPHPAPARQFDFWLGEWDASWGDGARGTNVVTAELDGAVVLERFDGRPGADFSGMSVSVYDVDLAAWQQTWVDSAGNYMPFAGGFADGVMDLRTERRVDGTLVPHRMLWHDIADDAFQWEWQRQEKNGSWSTLWHIDYERKA